MNAQIPKPYPRDLSWLKFNERVLQEAQDTERSILERLQFLGIFSNNLDEFFKVRVATLKRMATLNKNDRELLNQNPKKILKAIYHTVPILSKKFDQTFQDIVRELEKCRIFIKTDNDLSVLEAQYIQNLFNKDIKSLITPLMIESIDKLPLKDNTLYLACQLSAAANNTMSRYAIIEVPTDKYSRFIELPHQDDTLNYILLEDIIRYNLKNIFFSLGFDTFSSYIIKITRDAELDLSQEEIHIPEELKKAIKKRKSGAPTRLVYDQDIPAVFLEYLINKLGLQKDDQLIAGGRIHNFKDFMQFPASDRITSTSHEFASPITPSLLTPPLKMLNVIRQQDILLHFPYHSFEPIIDLLRECAIDPHVKSIQITIYRLAQHSKILNTLINASKNGKKVIVVLELRARFDEANNMYWKEKLEEEGVQVFTGHQSYKVHSKLCLITRDDGVADKEQYAIISTGNFNENTATRYSDFCLMTAHTGITKDIAQLFNCLKNPEKHPLDTFKSSKVIISPYSTRHKFIKLIDNEIKAAQKGEKAELIIKLNALTDEALIHKILEAAQKQVPTTLIIRSICSLKLPDRHPHLKIISIVDHFLEHSRAFYSYNGGTPKIYISSADWMKRNLDHRIETSVEIVDKNIQSTIEKILRLQIQDNVKARIIDKSQSNQFVAPSSPAIRSQLETLKYYQTFQ